MEARNINPKMSICHTRRVFIFYLLLVFCSSLNGQTTPQLFMANAHSHNDYVHAEPFTKAYLSGFGSIEVDLFLVEDQLLVAHELDETQPENTFERLYLNPILEAVNKSKTGYIYPENGQLQLLIDIKSAAIPTLTRLLDILLPHRAIFCSDQGPAPVKIVISGNRPEPADYKNYHEIIWFDGRIDEVYNHRSLNRIAMISAPFSAVSNWRGSQTISKEDRRELVKAIRSAHQLDKKFRFWGTPDVPNAWALFLELDVDFINTDKIDEFREYLKRENKQLVQ